MTHDVAISFASAQRDYIERMADTLKDRRVSVFLDRDYQSRMWGKNLLEYFDQVFRVDTRFFCIVGVSKEYAFGPWTIHERRIIFDRAFRESNEYILPLRFDDTEIPGGPTSTTGYIDARKISPEEAADLVCEKIENARFESYRPAQDPEFGWFSIPDVRIGDHIVTLRPFQHLLSAAAGAPLDNLVADLTRRILSSARQDQNRIYWTIRDDRYFDRVYATASVLTAIKQTCGPVDSGLLSSAVAFLQETEAGSIDDRAATIFLLTQGQLDESQARSFIDLLASRQISDSDPAEKGAFLFQQGPEKKFEHWPQSHRDGASFHACHVADALLHIPGNLKSCRARAEPILEGIRSFLIQSYTTYEGWLVSGERKRSPLTLFSYALCPALRIPLPRQWRETAQECMRMSSRDSGISLVRFFGILNAAYSAWSIDDERYTSLAVQFVREQLQRLPSASQLDELTVPDLAALLRSIAYGVNLIDRRFDPIIRMSVAENVRHWNHEG